jgi:starch-binding outer membrane protein, SusD/RagB family
MKKGILFLFAACLIIGSCKKFLTETPYSLLSTNNFYQSEGDAEVALNGVFATLTAQTYYGRTSWTVSELGGDDLTVPSNSSSDRITLGNYTATSSNGEVANWWNNIYSMINRANDVIEHVPGIQMDTAARNDIVGNAYFLRALGYFELIRSFGDVPLLLTPTTATSNLLPAKTPIASIYPQIISDLQYAEANCLQENAIPTANKGRVSSGAASTILAKVYLTRAATPGADPNDYTNGLAECNKVINSGQYALLPKYSSIFDWTNKFPAKPENIFSVQFAEPPSVGNIIIRMLTSSKTTPAGSASFYVPPAFPPTYIAADSIRKKFTMTNQDKSASGTYSTDVNYYYTKFSSDPTWTAQSNNSEANWIITRYADVLLMQSEALHFLNPTDPTQFNGINAVRARAGLTGTYQLDFTTTPEPDDFVTALVNERSWELCMEGHRKWDLIRLGRLQSALLTGKGVTAPSADPLLPIPLAQVALDSLLSQ